MRILYVGQSFGTSLNRARALQDLGHHVDLIDPHSFLPRTGVTSRLLGKLIYAGGAILLEPYIRVRLERTLSREPYDLAWIDSGELVGPSIVRVLRRVASRVVNYNVDDPFGRRDGRRFKLYQSAIGEYDLLVVVRDVNVVEADRAGAKKVLRVVRSASDTAHRRFECPDELLGWESEVLFVGTWMPERGPLIARMLELGVPLTIYGNGWRKAEHWGVIRAAWKGPGLVGRDYVRAIQGAKVCIGLVSKGNRDHSTTRSAEIPYIGSVLCAERTLEHQNLFLEDREAVFWDTPEECAAKCSTLLEDAALRRRIAAAGSARCVSNGMLDSMVVNRILDEVFAAGNLYASEGQSVRQPKARR